MVGTSYCNIRVFSRFSYKWEWEYFIIYWFHVTMETDRFLQYNIFTVICNADKGHRNKNYYHRLRRPALQLAVNVLPHRRMYVCRLWADMLIGRRSGKKQTQSKHFNILKIALALLPMTSSSPANSLQPSTQFYSLLVDIEFVNPLPRQTQRIKWYPWDWRSSLNAPGTELIHYSNSTHRKPKWADRILQEVNNYRK